MSKNNEGGGTLVGELEKIPPHMITVIVQVKKGLNVRVEKRLNQGNAGGGYILDTYCDIRIGGGD